jgi:hypothetical protein
MSTSVRPPLAGGRPARQRRARSLILAVVALVSVVSLIDAEVLAGLVPSIMGGAERFHLPTVITYAAVGAAGLLVLWLTVWLGRQVWRAERALAAQTESHTTC